MIFGRLLKLCEQSGFVRQLPHPNAEGALEIGPAGSLLLENLKAEWRNAVLNSKDLPVFCSVNGLRDSYDFVRDLCYQRLPFGVADVVQIQKTIKEKDKIGGDKIGEPTDSQDHENNVVTENVLDFASYFKCEDHLRCTLFVAPSEATDFLNQWQRQRRVWWRKFSPTPGRYFTTDIQTTSNGNQLVEVHAKYSWGTQLVENLTLSMDTHPLLTEEQQKNKFGRKKVKANYLTSLISVPTMYLNIICDAFEEPAFQQGTRPFFRFHRKLAPYKVGFSIPSSFTGSIGQDLADLALYICKKLKANNVSTLLLPSSTRTTLEEQFKQYDQLGIPYTVVVNESSLKNGIIGLRSRDTTLSEQVHISEVPNYVEILFKNY